jgi:hypothetical protein
VKAASGRRRYNVLGALNFASKKMTTITNDAYITSTQIIMLIDGMSVKSQNKNCPPVDNKEIFEETGDFNLKTCEKRG